MLGVAPGLRQNLGLVGTHAILLAGGAGLLFLQRYIWLLKIAAQGYGPYQTVSYLAGLSIFAVLLDLVVLGWSLRGSRTDRVVSLAWPAFFFGSALLILLGNNV